MSRILVTGGAGFIGSHTCLVLLEQGHELVVLDSFDNSSAESLRRIQLLAGSSMLKVTYVIHTPSSKPSKLLVL